MKICVLRTGIFPDADCIERSLTRLEQDNEIHRMDVSVNKPDNAAWDTILSALLKADKVITL